MNVEQVNKPLIATNVAGLAQVPVTDVSVAVVAGSAKITATIKTASAAAQQNTQATLNTNLGNRNNQASLGFKLGLPVTSSAQVKMQTGTVLLAGPSPPPPSPPPVPPVFYPLPVPPPSPIQPPPSTPPFRDDTDWPLIAYMILFGASMLALCSIGAYCLYQQRNAKALAVEA